MAWIALAVSVVLSVGCERDADPFGVANPAAAATTGTVQNGWDLPLMSADQLARAFPGTPCADASHREFDFWVGEWNVTSLAGAQSGTNIVTLDLDGCLVHEHWTGAGGSRGESLNTYDSETGLWHQTWASQTPQGIVGRLRTSGGIVDGDMALSSIRHATGGFTFIDSWLWHENEQGQVIQTAVTQVPEFNLTFPFTGVYTRQDITPAPPLQTQFCAQGQVGGLTRMADFLVGEWTVGGANEPTLAVSTITSELEDCVFVERFESNGGLRAVAFTYFDVWVERWFRTYVDSEGERLELEGDFENGALALHGVERSAGRDIDVMVSWQQDGDDVIQTWAISGDGGTTWIEGATVVYSPQ